MDRKKILFIMHELGIGGAERVVSTLVNNFDREKYEVHLCLFKKKGALVAGIAPDVVIHDLKAKRVLTSFRALYQLIVKLRPQVMFSSITHVNLLVSLFIPFLKRKMGHTIFITREVNNPSVRSKHLRTSRMMDRLYKKTISRFDIIVAQSNYMKQDILESYRLPSDRVTVMSNPVDIDAIDRRLSEMTGEALFDLSRKNILAVGGFRKQKSFGTLLEMMTFLDASYHLTILGEGPERSFLEARIAELGVGDKVSMPGLDPNPYRYMKQADVFVLSSRYEGFPNVIIEANVCGTFAVAGQCPGVDQEVIQEGLNGSLVPFADAKAMAEAVEKAVATRHDRTAIRNTSERFRVSEVVARYDRLINSKFPT